MEPIALHFATGGKFSRVHQVASEAQVAFQDLLSGSLASLEGTATGYGPAQPVQVPGGTTSLGVAPSPAQMVDLLTGQGYQSDLAWQIVQESLAGNGAVDLFQMEAVLGKYDYPQPASGQELPKAWGW